jgi:ring-1,2-phenylacetyl-CoA epoxidase subunit PaaB
MTMLINKIYYGDYGDREVAGGAADTAKTSPNQENDIRTSKVKTDNAQQHNPQQSENGWPLWEVFIRSKQGLDHKHAGSLHAADAQMAIENARDVYTRRMEGVSIWVVESKFIHASNPDEADSFYEPANDKVYRHPTFYELPEAVKYM